MRKDSPLSEKEFIAPKDLWDKPLIMSHQEERDGWPVASQIRRDVSKLNIVATYNLLFNGSLFGGRRTRYAICFDKLMNTTGDSVLCFRPIKPEIETAPSIVWKKYQMFSKAAGKIFAAVANIVWVDRIIFEKLDSILYGKRTGKRGESHWLAPFAPVFNPFFRVVPNPIFPGSGTDKILPASPVPSPDTPINGNPTSRCLARCPNLFLIPACAKWMLDLWTISRSEAESKIGSRLNCWKIGPTTNVGSVKILPLNNRYVKDYLEFDPESVFSEIEKSCVI